MRQKFLLANLILFTLSCTTFSVFIPTPVNTPMELTVIIPYPIQTSHPTPTNTPVPERIFSTPAVSPPWVAEFSDPIIAIIDDLRPNFQDDFPPVCVDEYKDWKICSTPEQRLYYQSPLSELVLVTPRATLDLQPDLQNGYALLNKGWFFIVPDSAKNPFYAHINNGALLLELPEGKETKNIWVYSPHLLVRNFVLQFDLEFGETQPKDLFRFQFEQAGGERFALDLTKDKTWTFHWGTGENAQTHTGMYDYLAFPRVRVLIIAQREQCAVYLNNVPLDYVKDCRIDPNQKITLRSVTFHILAEPGHPSMLWIDNVLMWDLEKLRK